jgi:glycosyltransferase involved in cell wall biosynthesis
MHWFVMTGELDPQIAACLNVDPDANPWKTTKRMHIINHGQPAEPFTQENEDIYEALSLTNAGKLKESLAQEDAVHIFHDAQPAGLFEYAPPGALKAFRLHIATRPDLIADPDSQQNKVWNFLRKKLKDKNGNTPDFVEVHPSRDPFIDEFLPKGSEAFDPDTVVFRPATMSPTGELGKQLSDKDRVHYIAGFDHILETPVEIPVVEGSGQTMTITQKKLNPDRRKVGGIHRFDEMKNIEGELESYLLYRQKMKEKGLDDQAYELIIAGQLAHDDPSGQMLFESTLRSLYTEEKYREIREDIHVARLQNNKRMLNAVGDIIVVNLTMSKEEGCEVKATEEKEKGKVVIGSYRGGIPRQLNHGIDSFIVEPTDYEAIANHLVTLSTEPETYARMSQAARDHVDTEYQTMADLRDWLGLIALRKSGRFATVMQEQRRLLGRQPFAKELIMAVYGDQIRERLTRSGKGSEEVVVFGKNIN